MELRDTGVEFLHSTEIHSAPPAASPALGTEEPAVNAAEMLVGPWGGQTIHR